MLHDCIDGLAASGNRFVLTSRYVARALRLLRDRSARFEVIHMPALTRRGHRSTSSGRPRRRRRRHDAHDADYLARTVQALADGRPAYVRALADELAAMREHGGPGSGDAISALAALLAPDGRLAKQCGFSYELRLHRARGYGALKAILEILAEEEGLTLTEISQRLQRTPGSTKDYLSWLEDVDLVTSRQKRYSFTDPLLRVWVRLHCRAVGADRGRSRARGAPLRAAAPAAAGASRRRRRRPSRRSRWPAAGVGDHRDRLGARGLVSGDR